MMEFSILDKNNPHEVLISDINGKKNPASFFNSWVLHSSLICTFVVSGRKIQKTAKYEEQWMNSQRLNAFGWYYRGL